MARVLPTVMLKVKDLVANPWNPNVESREKFSLLTESIEDIGFAESIQVVPIEGGKYRIVGGEHRWQAAKIAGLGEIPCTILDDVDEEKQKAVTVRMNLLKGELDPVKFTRLWDELAVSGHFSEQALRDMMGIASRKEFELLYKEVKAALPPEMQAELDKVKAEIRTIDDLSLVLNRLFRKHGSELQYSYMVLDWGGRYHTWVRLKKETDRLLGKIKQKCRDESVDINEFLCAGFTHVLGLEKDWKPAVDADLGIEWEE